MNPERRSRALRWATIVALGIAVCLAINALFAWHDAVRMR